ncbi:AMP-binding protein [Pseudorhodoferax sp.]|uniref:AMP-binding protein n=1 Tax=Pseudorhodoferax sp. TaxID=1993553 RepID=UPI002DD62707|nr:AMP-binding protein [Pseudorhodoferax sp.]
MRFQVADCPPVAQTTDPLVPARDHVVVRDLVDRWARECPDKVFLHFADTGEQWTYRTFRELVLQTALGLQQQGVGQGDHVLVWLPNGREHLRVYFAINYLGAVFVPINTAYKGLLLAHVIENSDATLAVLHSDLTPRMDNIALARLQRAIVVGARVDCPGLETSHYEDVLLPEQGTLAPLQRPIEPWDPMAIIYTSGTTGPSKGVLASYLHIYTNAGPETWTCVTGEDRFLVNMPLFHIGGMGVSYVMLVRGGSIAFVDRFETASFLDTVRRTGSTATFLLGVMASFLEKTPATPADADSPLRLVFMVPLAGDIAAFSRRFGCAVYTIFNMTEISTPIMSEPNPLVRGTCGRKRDGVDVRLVDDNDCEVPVGTVGEMLVRTDRPWGMNSGYYKNPQATATAWRNGWFHTGDSFRMDQDGYYYFVDRKKDAIRRRGENISSFEVEAEVISHPSVREAAAVGVASEFSEDDVLVVVAPADGAVIDPKALIEYLQPRMAHFMVPRYVRVVAELPKTPSNKVLKHELRNEGVTADTWDREKAGIQVRSDRFR